jgi:hypothetical protein
MIFKLCCIKLKLNEDVFENISVLEEPSIESIIGEHIKPINRNVKNIVPTNVKNIVPTNIISTTER